MIRYFLFFLLIATSVISPIFASIPIMKFEDVQAGMRGTGKTVFGGMSVEEFQVEILGKLENIGPKQNVILAKLSGGPLEKTGVLSGMSGSPVYIDGKLIGAAAFMWGFSKEPIAGITPIEEMLSIEEEHRLTRTGTREIPRTIDLSLLSSPHELMNFFSKRSMFQRIEGVYADQLTPIGLPLITSGFSSHSMQEMRRIFEGTPFWPLQAGGTGQEKSSPPKIEGGSAVAVQLVRGDISISAVGTATAVDGENLLAFGHPLFNIGSIEMPMAAANVETLLPSLAASFKIAEPSGEIGSFIMDRASGMLGKIGRKPQTIPVRVEIQSSGKNPTSFSFDIINNKNLTPILLYISLNGILSSEEKEYGDTTILYKEGSLIRLSEGRSINLANLYSGDYSRFISTATLAYITYLIMDNEYAESRIEGINLLLDYLDTKKLARIEKVWCDRSRIRPGEKITLTVSLKPYRGNEFIELREVEIPEEIPPGELMLKVGDAYILSRMERMEEESELFVPRDFDHLIWLLNHLRTNDKIYIIFSRKDTGVFMEGTRFPNLPLSRSSIIIRPQTKGNYSVMDERVVMEESIETGYAVEGYKKIILEVEEK